MTRLCFHLLSLSAVGPAQSLRFRRIEESALVLLIFAGLTLAGILYLKRQDLRRRIWSMRISPQALHELIHSGRAPLIIDLRSPLDMLPGAIRVTPEEIPLAAMAMAMARDGDIVLYCTWPRETTSINIAIELLDAGFTRVRLLSGGFQAWKRLGYELQDAADMIRWPSHARATPGAKPVADILYKL